MALCSPLVVNRLLSKYVVRNGDVWQPIKRIAVGPARGLDAVPHSSQFHFQAANNSQMGLGFRMSSLEATMMTTRRRVGRQAEMMPALISISGQTRRGARVSGMSFLG